MIRVPPPPPAEVVVVVVAVAVEGAFPNSSRGDDDTDDAVDAWQECCIGGEKARALLWQKPVPPIKAIMTVLRNSTLMIAIVMHVRLVLRSVWEYVLNGTQISYMSCVFAMKNRLQL